MDKETILKLTLVQFGLMQDPPLDENILRLIQGFACREPDISPDAKLWSETMRLASSVRTIDSAFTPERKAELEASFRRRIAEDTDRLTKTTVAEVIDGWFTKAERYSKCEDWNWRSAQKNIIMRSFLSSLRYLAFPDEDIEKLQKSADYVAEWRPSERDTSHDAGP